MRRPLHLSRAPRREQGGFALFIVLIMMIVIAFLVVAATQSAWSTGQPEDALANATPYLQAFGHLVLAWVWLDVALVAAPAGAQASAASQGRLQACHYFFDYELPKIDAWLSVVASRNRTCRDMRDEWF